MKLSVLAQVGLVGSLCASFAPMGKAQGEGQFAALIQQAQLAAFTDCASGKGYSFVLQKVRFLDSGSFDVENNGGTGNQGKGSYSEPVPSKDPVGTPYSDDLADAFDAAPQQFKNELCKLKWMFVDRSHQERYGWGFWEAADQRPHGRPQKFIGIASEVWGGQNPAPRLTHGLSYGETDVLQALLDPWKNTPRYLPQDGTTGANPDTPQMALLAILAHEVGHVIWYREHVDTWEDCNQDANTLDVFDFFYGSWSHVAIPRRFHKFNSGDDTSVHQFQQDASLEQIMSEVPPAVSPGSPPPDDSKAMLDLEQLYLSGRWASLFASIAPDEDFVETYALLTLYSAGLTSLPIEFFDNSANPPSSTGIVDVVANLRNSQMTLNQKASCIATHLKIQFPLPRKGP